MHQVGTADGRVRGVGLSISLPKSQFGMKAVDYLGLRVSGDGIEAKPKNLDELLQVEFPRTVKGIQSFLGSLNYYHRFVDHFAAYGAALYEITPADLATDALEPGHLDTARRAFTELKRKLAEAPLLRHFDASKQPTVVHATAWSIAGSVMQEHDGVLVSVRHCSRVLKPNEAKFSPAEREVLAPALDNRVAVQGQRTARSTGNLGCDARRVVSDDHESDKGRGRTHGSPCGSDRTRRSARSPTRRHPTGSAIGGCSTTRAPADPAKER